MKAVVLGGGIAGVFTAYFLRELGFDVVGVGGDVAYPLTSLVLTLSMPYGEDVELAKESLEIYRKFVQPREVTSVDIFPRWVTLPKLEVPHEVTDSVEGLRLGPDEVAVLTRDYLIPVRKVVNRLRRELGFASSYGFLKVEDGKAYVVAEGRRIAGDVVVLAAGYNNRALAEKAGLRLPLQSYECYAVAYAAWGKGWRYSVGDHVLGWYGRPIAPFIYVAGDGCGRYGQGPPANYVEKMTNLLRQRIGAALPLGLRVGYCEVGPHGGPVYGKHPDVDNLYVIGGLDGYGSMVGPSLAKRLADLIAGREEFDEFKIERYMAHMDFDPCAVSERHDWGSVILRKA